MLRPTAVLILFTLLFGSELSSQTSPAPSSTDKGTAIGTTVRAALEAAFPGAGSLATLLIDAAATKVKMKKEQKAEAQAAAEAAAKKNQDELRAKSNRELKELDSLVTQLNVVINFADASSTANEEVIRIISYLSSNSQPTTSEWSLNVRSRWKSIQATLGKLDSYDGNSTLDSMVKDLYVRDLLGQILKARTTKIERLNDLIKEQPQFDNIGVIKDELIALQPLLSGVSRVAVLQVKTLALDLHSAANPEKMGSTEEGDRKERYESIHAYLKATDAN